MSRDLTSLHRCGDCYAVIVGVSVHFKGADAHLLGQRLSWPWQRFRPSALTGSILYHKILPVLLMRDEQYDMPIN